MNIKFHLLALAALIILSSFSNAHLEAGSDDVVNGYLIDFGHSPKNPGTVNSTFINFNILENSTQLPVNVTGAWIRISDKENVIFAATLKPAEGNAGMLFTFPREGDYEIAARFYIGPEVIAENKYDIEVIGSNEPMILKPINLVLMISVAVLSLLILSRHAKKMRSKFIRKL